FQAEDGIRDRNVTGVQTCALPIFSISDPNCALTSAIWEATTTPSVMTTSGTIAADAAPSQTCARRVRSAANWVSAAAARGRTMMSATASTNGAYSTEATNSEPTKSHRQTGSSSI